MFPDCASFAVPGAAFPTARAASRRAELDRCAPGEPLELRRERGTIGRRRAVGVYSARGIQIGYLRPDDAEEVAGLIAVARAIFMSAEPFGAAIRMTVDGSAPTLPPSKPPRRRIDPPAAPADEFCDIFPSRLRR